MTHLTMTCLDVKRHGVYTTYTIQGECQVTGQLAKTDINVHDSQKMTGGAIFQIARERFERITV